MSSATANRGEMRRTGRGETEAPTGGQGECECWGLTGKSAHMRTDQPAMKSEMYSGGPTIHPGRGDPSTICRLFTTRLTVVIPS